MHQLTRRYIVDVVVFLLGFGEIFQALVGFFQATLQNVALLSSQAFRLYSSLDVPAKMNEHRYM